MINLVNDFFVEKLKILCNSDYPIFVQISQWYMEENLV